MRRDNYLENAPRVEISYYSSKESLREIDMRMDYINDRGNNYNGFKNPTRRETVYLVMEREIIGIMI